MPRLTRIAGDCPDGKTCPAAWAKDTDPDSDSVYVVGVLVEDDLELMAKSGAGEGVVRVPRDLWEQR